MKLIGLTGGIGSGKSTVAALLAERGFAVVDADQVARDIVKPGEPALAELAAAFGADVISVESGELNRGLLARRAFADEESTSLLNSITHPRIHQRTQELFNAARSRGEAAVIYDMPLLVEGGLHTDMDLTVVVDVEPEERVRRLVEYRGLDAGDARRRIAAQVPDHVRRDAADVVINNNGGREGLASQVEQLVAKIDELVAS